MSSSRIQEYAYISLGFSRVFLIWLLEYLNLISNGEAQITIDDLLKPDILSKLIKQPVESVCIDSSGVSRGAGGTGTTRAPLLVTLLNGQVLHLFAKTPTKALAERAFFTLFRVYENEVTFYSKYFNQMNALLKRDNWDIGPRVHYCKYEIFISLLSFNVVFLFLFLTENKLSLVFGMTIVL